MHHEERPTQYFAGEAAASASGHGSDSVLTLHLARPLLGPYVYDARAARHGSMSILHMATVQHRQYFQPEESSRAGNGLACDRTSVLG